METSRRTMPQSYVGRLEAAEMSPVLAVPFEAGEGGMLVQQIGVELDPIVGRMITEIHADVTVVFVPVEAIDLIRDPEAEHAGLREVVKAKLLTGSPLFPLEMESDLSKRMGIFPISIGGELKVCGAARWAYNTACNYLRRRVYYDAEQVAYSNFAVLPAVLSRTVLDMFGGALDPDPRINGTVDLELQNFPVKGIRRSGGNIASTGAFYSADSDSAALAAPGGFLEFDITAAASSIYADATGQNADISLADFYVAEKMDKLVRVMGEMLQKNPELGQENILQWVHGLRVDTGAQPFVVYERRHTFGKDMVGATDSAGIEDDVMRSDLQVTAQINVPIPVTELGGIVITIVQIKPDEYLRQQPHPVFSRPWTLRNHAADSLKLDPVAVLMRELSSECPQADETQVAFWVGNNGMMRNYQSWGLSRHFSSSTLTGKTVTWQYEIPPSVTPENILYPTDFPALPFAVQTGPIATYTVQSVAMVNTPIQFGPSPVERLPIIDDETLLEG